MRSLRRRIRAGFFCKSMTLSRSGSLWYIFFLGLLPEEQEEEKDVGRALQKLWRRIEIDWEEEEEDNEEVKNIT